MKQLVKLVVAASIVIACSQSAWASDHSRHHAPAVAGMGNEKMFSLELDQQNSEVIVLTIKNPGRRNLSVVVNAPDGTTVDNFFTGKKEYQVKRLYNFSGADSGVYTVEVSNGSDKIKKQVKLERVTVDPLKLTVQ